MRRTLAAWTLWLAACGPADPGAADLASTGDEVAANQNAPPPSEAAVAPAIQAGSDADSAADRETGAEAEGSGMERPIASCGLADSHARVARFRCPDGSVPLGGDLEAARAARLGRAGTNPNGHLIDRYVLPCPGGDVSVYVDTYGCEEIQGLLAQ